MPNEEQKYDSSVFKNLGFAFLTPIGSIMFQLIVFKRIIFESNLSLGIIICIIGIVLICFGRIVLKEKKNERK